MFDMTKTEIIKCDLNGITCGMEWSQPEGRDMPVIKFRFEEHDTNRTIFHKTRIFSQREDTREKAVTGLNEIDHAMKAGGAIVKAALDVGPYAENHRSDIDIVMAADLDSVLVGVKGVIVVYRHSESTDPKSGRVYTSSFVHRVLPWDENIEAVISNVHPDDFIGMRGDVASFCQTKEWLIVRREVLKLFGARCLCCGATSANAVITVDHIIPRSRKPALSLSPSNLQVLCRECNVGKGSDDETDYRSDDQIEAARRLEKTMTSDD
ncbi:HNH endonuclease [Pantoea phage vB_PagM_LIET2]|uniref:HNH endonuclease n=1 Tax=Pantoea phage vB_PagM_LIET2 TaxID=2508071 RepID=A0A411AWB0_9CAUD|nr:HNH endonuclease [Pantoea phage vB_PagM_LIET2]QAX92376.1 HNH endonuclease [Pantoea phage vB_PagM_LIET2]